MKQRWVIFLLLLIHSLSGSAYGKSLQVFTCEPEWAALVTELAGDKVQIFSATSALQNPHHIEARPSLIAQARRADLMVCTGADLEVGWLPLLQRRANNPHILPGNLGYFEAADYVTLLEVPERVDRTMGDVHAAGNPHIHLHPYHILQIAKPLSERLQALDPDHKACYQENYKNFSQRWQQAIKTWEQQILGFRGKKVIMHHRNWTYLRHWLALEEVTTLEPKPGIPPSAAHLKRIYQYVQQMPADVIIRTPYEDARPSQWLSSHTHIPALALPYSVGATPETEDLFGLFDDIIATLSTALC